RSMPYGEWKNPLTRGGSSPSVALTRNLAQHKNHTRRSMWEERAVMARGARRGMATAGTDSILTSKRRNVAPIGFAAILKLAPAHPNWETLKSQSRPRSRLAGKSYASTKTLEFIGLSLG